MRKLYLAYGSNLSMEQMARRTRRAIPVGTATLDGYRLLFRGSMSGSYLTVEPCEGRSVPLVVWSVDEADEKALDRYEGFPRFYYKKEIQVELRSLINGTSLGPVPAFIYIMHEDRPLDTPSPTYLTICLEGYARFGFNPEIMRQALIDSVGKRRGQKCYASCREEVF